MNIAELYEYLDKKIPSSLSCEWDNDGLMCCSDPDREVRRVLVALDVTDKTVSEAISGDYDLIISHHPLIFKGIRSVTPYDITASKVIDLIKSDIAVMSFHTRLDAVEGGVNDELCSILGITGVEKFGPDGELMGRIGNLEKPTKFSDFSANVKDILGCDAIFAADSGRYAYRVAVLGGSGSDFVGAAKKAGADTFITGELGYHHLCDAAENGMNIISAGHFQTENPVCDRIADVVSEADPYIEIDIMDSLSYDAI